jgi:CBS-domain-containing membrane protein
MFSVYGRAGRLFRGSMEDLRKIVPTAAIGRSRRIGAIGREDLEAGLPTVGAHAGAAAHGARPDAAHRDAMAAYAQSAQLQPARHPLTLVRDIMHSHALTLREDATVAQAWDLLAQQQLGQAPVVNASGMLVGLLTRAELMRPDRLPGSGAHALVWQALLMQSVADLMWTPVPSVAPETDIRRLARVLLDTGLPGLPVVDEQGHVSAFVSRTDILHAVVADPPLDLWS